MANTKKKESGNAKCTTISINDALKHCAKKGFRVPFALEELLPPDIWDYAESQNWLEDRPNVIKLYDYSDPKRAFNDHIDQQLSDPHLKRLALKKVQMQYKLPLIKYIQKKSREEQKLIFGDFLKTVSDCLSKLKIETDLC